jgi:tungstate transport system substrate-binding protein
MKNQKEAKMRNFWRLAILLVLVSAVIFGCSAQTTPTVTPKTAEIVTPATSASGGLVLATTTSTHDSGLLDHILPDFEVANGVKVKVVAVGTGQAIKLGESGDADVILVHAREREDKFVAEGYGTARADVMYNDFVIIGPASDPGGIKGTSSASQAFQEIAEGKHSFISRGDSSGTHSKEMAIWAQAGIEPQGDWYISAGQGMGAVLNMANERLAYTLTDRGTYLSRQEALDLPILMEGDEILFNPYGIIPVNPEKHPQVRHELAQKLVEWITSVEVQEEIASFVKNGQTLFRPNSETWQEAHPQGGEE